MPSHHRNGWVDPGNQRPDPKAGTRELIIASPQQGTLDSGSPATATITFNEPGICDLSRLQVGAFRDDPAATGTGVVPIDITGICRVSALTLNGAVLFVRGRNTAMPPAAAFSRLRIRNWFNLPRVQVQSGDTLAVTLIFIQTDAVARFSIAAPFAPARFRGVLEAGVMAGKAELIVGSPEVTVTDVDGTSTDLTITFDTPGLIDLSRTIVKVSALKTLTIAADGYAPESLDDIPVYLLQFILRSDYNIVVGQNTPSAPNPFDHKRAHNWYALGIHRVVPGDQLVASISMFGSALLDNASASMSVPQVADAGFGGLPDRHCPPPPC